MSITPLTVEDIARTCHEVNRIYCRLIGDPSEAPWPWDDAPDWHRQSYIKGVRFVLKNPGYSEEDQHNAWLGDKLLEGWRYGVVKNAECKEHPCLLLWDQLPLEQKTKDILFRNTIKSLLPLLEPDALTPSAG